VFDPQGTQLGDFSVSGTTIDDLAVHAESGSVLATGYRQSDEGACQQYKSTFVRSYAYDGTLKWTNYDWDGTEVDDTEDCADSEGKGLAIGRDGKLYYAGKSDGGNTVHRKQPRDLQVDVVNVSFDPYNTGYGFKGANALGYYARFDPATGEHLGGQFLLARKATGDEASDHQAQVRTPMIRARADRASCRSTRRGGARDQAGAQAAARGRCRRARPRRRRRPSRRRTPGCTGTARCSGGWRSRRPRFA
jgi:hypothetical protein